ncbi:MAG TPA: peptide ABC transporter substrate-binding protein [Chloroflexota bacterium]|nr:peptide ABC transporter substrate-binding protein [Chloroflexota bacterium]
MAGLISTRRGLIASLAAIALLAPAIGPARATPAKGSSGALVYPNEPNSSLWVKTLDPAQVTDAYSIEVINLLYSGLVVLNGNNQVVPDLAAAMPTISADRLTYTFKLKPNLKFSDGTPLVASDFVYSLTRALSKAEASPTAMLYIGHIKGAAALNAGKTNTLAGVQAPDDSTVVITLDRPIGYFLETLTYPTGDVVEPTLKTGVDLSGPNAQSRNVGTGPYMFSRAWRYRSEMYFKPNPNWYNASKLKIQEIDMPFIASDVTSYAEYEGGQIPMTSVPVADVPSASSQQDYHNFPALGMNYIVPNLGPNSACKPVSCAPFNDIHFRRALMYAVDQNTIDNVVLHGTQKPLCSFIPKGIEGYDDKDLCPLSPFNPARAKAELALAKKDFGGKLPNDGNFQVVYRSGNQGLVSEYIELQNEWANVGINMNITTTPVNNWLTLVTETTTPFLDLSWGDDYPDPQDFTENLLTSTSPYNSGSFHNARFDKLNAEADVLLPGPERTKLYVEMQKIAMANVAYIMVGQPYTPFRWKTSLHGFYGAPGYPMPRPVNNDWTNASVG